MKNIFYILLLLPTIIFAQYPSNSGQKITLGEQTTADGLVFRGVANDTNVITPFSDTSAYIILDTVNSKFYHYNRTTTYWSLAGGGGDSGGVTSFSAGTTGLTPSTATTGAVTLGGTLSVANGGTGSATQNFVDLTTTQSSIAGKKTFTTGIATTANIDGDPQALTLSNTSSGTSAESTLYVRNESNNNASIFFQTVGTDFTSIGGFLNDQGTIGTGTLLSNGMAIMVRAAADMRFYTSGHTNERMRITSNGNVGIGTTSPAAKFQVTDASSSITLQNYLNGAAIFLDGVNGDFVGGDYFHILADSSSYLGVGGYAGGTTPLNVSNNGNVGIGTTSPTARLYVKGSTPDGTASAFKIDNSGNTNLLNILNNGVATFRNISNSGAPATTGTSVVATLSIDNANSVMTNIGNFTTSPFGVWLQVQDRGALGTTYPLTLQPIGGNVGIGTTGPGYKLDVQGAGNTRILNFSTSSVGTGYLYGSFANTGGGAYLGVESSTGGSINTGGLAYGSFLGTQGATALQFATDGVARMTILPTTGNVGIGTTSPDEPLHVVKSTSTTNSITEVIHVQAKTTGTLASGFGPSIGFWGALTGGNNVELGQIGAVNTNINGANGDLVFYTRPNAPIVERMRISSTGAVTINNLGSGTVTASSGTLTTSSDSTYKIDAGFIDSALDKVMNLKPRYFYWNDKSGLPMDVRQLGFYAQEVNSAIGEEAANTPKENIPWGINDRSLIAFLTKAIQEQQSQIDILKQEIINLKNK